MVLTSEQAIVAQHALSLLYRMPWHRPPGITDAFLQRLMRLIVVDSEDSVCEH